MARYYRNWWGCTTRRYERACELGTWLGYLVQVQTGWRLRLTEWRLRRVVRWIRENGERETRTVWEILP